MKPRFLESASSSTGPRFWRVSGRVSSPRKRQRVGSARAVVSLVADEFADVPDEALEQRLVQLAFSKDGGRRIEAQKSAIRSVLKLRRERRESSRVEGTVRRATELVNAVRPKRYRITEDEMNPHEAAAIVTEPRWAKVYATDAEIAAALQDLRKRITRRRTSRQ
jgi:hypothetical protein